MTDSERQKQKRTLPAFLHALGWDPESVRRETELLTALKSWRHEILSLTVEGQDRLRLDIKTREIVPGKVLSFAEGEICRCLGLGHCAFYLHYPKDFVIEDNMLCGFLPWAAEALADTELAIFRAFLPQLRCRSDEKSISINIPPAQRKIFSRDNIKLLEKFYEDRLGFEVTIEICNGKKDSDRGAFLRRREENFCDMEAAAARFIPDPDEAPQRVLNEHGEPEVLGTPRTGHSRKTKKRRGKSFYRQKQPDGLIWGRMDNRLELTDMKLLDAESGLVSVYGAVANYESRLVSNNTCCLVKFALYGIKGAISCFMFLRKPEEEPQLRAEIPNGTYVRADLEVSYDGRFNKDLQGKVKGICRAEAPPKRRDLYPEKRVELHLHTNMSAKDGHSRPADLVKLADSFGMPAVAITDHGVVQAFPEACDALDEIRAEGSKMKLIYGCEIYLMEDGDAFAYGFDDLAIGETYVALDLETTGLDPSSDRIIEIGAVRFRKDESGYYFPEERYETLVNPGIPLPAEITKLTGIRPEDLEDGKPTKEALEELHAFLGEDPLCAHNAFFDLGFLRHEAYRVVEYNAPKLKFNPVLIDTLPLSRRMLPELKRHTLNTVADYLHIPLAHHHRAADDAVCCGFIFAKLWAKNDFKPLRELNQELFGQATLSRIKEARNRPYHCIVLVKNLLGLYNLYRLVSASHIRYFRMRPRIPRSLLKYLRDGLIIGSACEAGEIFRGITSIWKDCEGNYEAAEKMLLNDEGMKKKARFYDYLEIQPLGNNAFMLEKDGNYVNSKEDLADLNRLVLALGDRNKIDVAATCDAHFLNEEDGIYRQILQTANGFDLQENITNLYFRNTEEMLAEFSYLDPARAREVVIENTEKIAAQVDPDLRPFPKGTFPPKIQSAAEDVQKLTWDACRSLYEKDGKIPETIKARVDKELTSIIDNGFAIMYYISYKLVKKTNEDGYIVGSRGSVGSSMVAYLCGISEVNPLPPHYVCPKCRYSEFAPEGAYGSGFDLPEKKCPECGAELRRDGQDIPFETFLGFNGDKQPDIDLNFSGEYQATAHQYIEEMFGSKHTYRAGTITGYAEKNALGLVLKYIEEAGIYITKAEAERLASGLIGIKRSTGQHPGGIVVIPKEREVYDFTPIQFPADKQDAVMNTTHFDFNAMHDTILKLDILGHDDPTMLKVMSDYTGVDIESIPIPDPKVMELFRSTAPLGLEPGSTPSDCGTLGLPEMGTRMAREMIRETQPTQFFDLVQLMGLSHGTDVWSGNAQDLIRSGTATINEVIGCRDGIMTNLINWGLPSKMAFDIMEKVRKGRGLTEEHESMMRKNHVPEWYIESCKKIKYMFPKAHAAAYVISSLRVAYFKVYYPEAYYAAYFSVRADEFDYSLMCQPQEKITRMREELEKNFHSITDREQKIFYILELVEEMYLRGIKFADIDIEEADPIRFKIVDKGLIMPALNTLPSVSTTMAQAIAEARRDGPFKNHEELQRRAGLGPSAVAAMAAQGILDHIPESAQITLFDMIS